MGLITSMSTRGKITLAGCGLAFLVAALMIVKMAGAPSYSTIQTGIDPKQSSKITAALDQSGIGWELQNGGTALAVEKSKAAAARIALAGQGLNTASQPGYELLDKQKLGASDQQQQVAYQRGLEGEIANTISQIKGAEGSTVRLTMAKDDLFADESRSATAAVLLGGSAEALDAGAIKGIANLVASSVPGLKPAGVTITDATGQMLWPSGSGDAAAGESGGLAAKPAAEAKYNAQVATVLNAMLTRTLGADKAQVQVTSDLDVDKASEESLEYAKKGVPLSQKVDKETLAGQNAAAGGTAGAEANIPSYTSTTAGGGNSGNNYNSEKTETAYALNKKVTRTQKAPGAINKLSVSVMVDKAALGTGAAATAQQAAITKAVQAAVGYDKARGDVVQVTPVAFAKLPAAKSPAAAGLPIPPAFAGILKAIGVGIGALLFLFFVTRHLRKRESETLLDEPSWLKQLEATRPQPMLPMPEGGYDAPSIATSDPRRQALDEVIAQQPERVAAHLRGWIAEDAA